MKKTDLKFGNKGNVWNNECHIAKGSEPTTMCGVPMLSSNWARIEDVQEIGCKECLRLYKSDAIGTDYYNEQLGLLQPFIGKSGLKVKFYTEVDLNNDSAQTKWLGLNDESASAIVEFLSNNFTLTLK